MFGNWVARRRRQLGLTQRDLAREVSCSLSMIRKVERDERHPSEQLAVLLADHLAIDDTQRGSFLNLARRKFIRNIEETIQASLDLEPAWIEIEKHEEAPPPFVGRERQLQQLQKHLDQIIQGDGRMVFIAGEAGRGKSSLLSAFARQTLDAHPNLVLVGGSCDVYTGQGDPLLPFRDIFRTLVGDIENVGMREIITHKLVARLEHTFPIITEILLENGPHLIDTLISGEILEKHLAKGYPHNPKNMELLLHLQGQRAQQTSSVLQELRQDHLFDEISSTLNAFARRQPLILMLEDTHWIDQSSAALLGHLAMRIKKSPILIISTYRPEDLAQRRPVTEQDTQTYHPLAEVLSESLRQFGHNRIDLDDTEPGEELEFVNAFLDVSDNDFGETFRVQLARLTEGHPLFTVELLRDMKDRGDIIQGDDGRWKEQKSLKWLNLPARVEGVIEKRITRLPQDLLGLLSLASVDGENFYAEVIARVRQMDPIQLTRKLGVVLDRQHRLIHEQGVKHVGTKRLSQYRFQHHLFQKYIYGRLAPAERMYLHEAVGIALEELFEGGGIHDKPAAQLARHFHEARLGVKASEYMFLAGQQAARILAFDEAVMQFRRGIEELKNLGRTPEINRLEYKLSLALGEALWHSGRVVDSMNISDNTIDIARTLDDSHALAQAVLAYEEPRWRLGLGSEHLHKLIREALTALGDEKTGLRVRLLVGLARNLFASGDQDELNTIAEEALQIARQIDDPLALYESLRIKVNINRSPEFAPDRLAIIQEMINTAESIGNQERLADALDLNIYDLLELGQIDRVDQIIAAQRQIAHEIRQPFQMYIAVVFQTMRAIMRGEFQDAEKFANEAANLSQEIGIAEMDGILGIHMFTIRLEQGRLPEITPIVKLIIAQNPEASAWRPGLALIYRSLGLKTECRDIFESLASSGFSFVPQDSLGLATIAYLSVVCAYLEDVDRAKALYELLLPYRHRAVVVGGATACYGAAARYLGMLSTTLSDWENAEQHFQDAIELDTRMESWPWLAHSQYEYATMMLIRGRAQDQQRAKILLEEASNAAQRMGMSYLVKKIESLEADQELFLT